MQSSLLNTGILDLLEADPRPSFIVAHALPAHPPAVVYANPALNNYPALLDLTTRQEDHKVLWKWVTSPRLPPPEQASPVSAKGGVSFSYLNVLWTRSIVTDEMVVVGANELPLEARFEVADSSQESLEKNRTDHAKESLIISLPSPALDHRANSTPAILPATPSQPNAVQFFGPSASDPGCIPLDVMPEQRPFLDVINSVNWAATPLGPIDKWPTKLEHAFNQILVDSRPIAIYWGPSSTTIYNEAFSRLCGLQHPAMLGMPVEETWSDAGPLLKESLRTISLGQRGTVEYEWPFFVERESETEGGANWLEEIYLKFHISPTTQNGEVLGFTHAVAETTSMRLWERRMKMLIELGDVLVTARDVRSYWRKTLQQLAAVKPKHDIPMAILYSVEDDPDCTAASHPRGGVAKICRLAGTLAGPEKHPIVPTTIKLGTGGDSLASAFGESLAADHPILLQTSDGTLPQALLQGLKGVPCRAAVVCPIRPIRRQNVMGLLLLGLNPHRPYDSDYRQYISLLSQKLTTSLASVVLLEEEARRRRTAAEQAAYDQAMLKEKLEVQTKEAHESIQLFEAVAEFVPVGMCFNDPNGNITYANDAWYEITGCTQAAGPISTATFLKRVKEEDREIIVAAHKKITTENARCTEFEFRVKKQADLSLIRNSPSLEKTGLDPVSIDELTERHVHAISRAERASDGTIIRVLTCLTDVTVHKRTAEEAVWRAQQADNLKRMAEFATVGMCDMDLEGRLLGANNVFFEMCGLEKVDPAKVDIKPWEIAVVSEDHSLLTEKIAKMVLEDKVQNLEVRLKTKWASDDGKLTHARWVQATMMPVRSTEGVVQSFTGCMSDVSLQKWQLEREKESRRQQENFIDMTSHEMRNPMNAMIHCADDIIASLTRVKAIIGTPEVQHFLESSIDSAEVKSLLDSSIDSAETIVDGAQHQKRIVDDILTMSKLDSKMLAITPITVNPIMMAREALKMFEIQARQDEIDLSMAVDKSYRDLKIEYLDFDPSRLKQILINLLANALKFTNKSPTRKVSVAISASLSRPTGATSEVQFIPRSQEYDQGSSSSRGDSVFIMFEIKDTGKGLSEEEKKSLFQRFVQASSLTHVNYGGSGLGLFISRRLAELQSGQIGVASQPGVGSTFAFYIEASKPSKTAIREANASAAALRTSANEARNRNTHAASSSSSSDGDGDSTALKGPSRPNTSTATRLGEMSSPSPSPALSTEIRGILVVEDNSINQRVARRRLLKMGFDVDVANNGEECLEKLRSTDRYVSDDGGGAPIALNSRASPATSDTLQPRFPLSVILMDIEMPVQDGLTCTKKIRELEKAGKISEGRIPIIAVSGNARAEQIEEALDAGCDDFVVKPYRLPELMGKMQSLMERRS
ncbi:hypothetical protein QBC44DRAFT_231094 [Cladorrhinum sp. PSN332]|nr:hypothetical protein QBC44DRAFT_231094 [Cladorrhinum sp. PSN332]